MFKGEFEGDLEGDLKGYFMGDLKGDFEVDLEVYLEGDFRGDLKLNLEGDLLSSSGHTPALSHNQVFKKGSSKWSMNLGPPYQYDAEMWWQNLRRWGKSYF